MIERIMEIIVFLINNNDDTKSLQDYKFRELENQGYTKSEISTAFSWLFEKVDLALLEKLVQLKDSKRGFRLLHNIEKDLFTPEALKELQQFAYLGLITPYQLDMLLERLHYSGMFTVDTQFLRSYLAALHLESMNFSNKPGRTLLLGNDTIN
ncbi:hypothetical protein MASR1M45_06760 [Candidatus Kapaibacterium sp.]